MGMDFRGEVGFVATGMEGEDPPLDARLSLLPLLGCPCSCITVAPWAEQHPHPPCYLAASLLSIDLGTYLSPHRAENQPTGKTEA